MNRILVMLKRVLGIGLLAVILSFFSFTGLAEANDYIAADPPETINLFGDKLHPVYIGTTRNHMKVYTTQESLDNLLAYKGYDGKYWDLYIILVPETEEKHNEIVSSIIEKADRWVTWLPAESRILWGIGIQMSYSLLGAAYASSYDLQDEYYNPNGEIIGFQCFNEDDFNSDAIIDTVHKLDLDKVSALTTDFIHKWYDEHKMNTYNRYIQ